jgi:hypothetical protein
MNHHDLPYRLAESGFAFYCGFKSENGVTVYAEPSPLIPVHEQHIP